MSDPFAQAAFLLQAGGELQSMLVPIALMVAIFYFLLIRPQSKERKAQAAMRSSLKKGDKILTQGGVVAVIGQVKETEVVLDLENTARMRVVREAVVRVIESKDGGEAKEDK